MIRPYPSNCPPNRTLKEYDNFEPFALFCIVDDKSGISGSKESLPATTLGLPDHMVGFILVSEPEDEELDCEEVGVAKVDLRELIKAREDLVEKPVDVFRSGHKLNLHSFFYNQVTTYCYQTFLAYSNIKNQIQ